LTREERAACDYFTGRKRLPLDGDTYTVHAEAEDGSLRVVFYPGRLNWREPQRLAGRGYHGTLTALPPGTLIADLGSDGKVKKVQMMVPPRDAGGMARVVGVDFADPGDGLDVALPDRTLVTLPYPKPEVVQRAAAEAARRNPRGLRGESPS